MYNNKRLIFIWLQISTEQAAPNKFLSQNHQYRHLFALFIFEPAGQVKTSKKSTEFDSAPLIRYFSGEWSSSWIAKSQSSAVIFRQYCCKLNF